MEQVFTAPVRMLHRTPPPFGGPTSCLRSATRNYVSEVECVHWVYIVTEKIKMSKTSENKYAFQ